MELAYYHSPIGFLAIKGTDNVISRIQFVEKFLDKPSEKEPAEITKCIKQLDEYFSGKRKTFSINISPEGTFFQRKVWKALEEIKFGITISYGDLARKLDDPKSIRAVGKANSQNPIAVIIPCHRVIGSNNKLVGYSGGIERKKYLLKHEGALLL